MNRSYLVQSPLPMVCPLVSFWFDSYAMPADVEAEDLELGHTEHEDFSLAGEHYNDDRLGSPDSGDEKELREELGIDTDESDCAFLQ